MTDTTPIFDPTPRYLSADGKWIETTPDGYDIPLLAKGADVFFRRGFDLIPGEITEVHPAGPDSWPKRTHTLYTVKSRVGTETIGEGALILRYIDWDRIKRLAGPNEQWPGRPVYLYCSCRIIEDPEVRLPALRREAETQGWSIALPGDGHLYLLGPPED